MTVTHPGTASDHGTVVEVSTVTLGDELAAGRPGATNLLTDATLTVASGAITGWTGFGVTITGLSGNPTVTQTNPYQAAWLRSPSWPVTAGVATSVAINVGPAPQTLALVFPDGTEVVTTSSNRIALTGTPGVSGSAWLELRWAAQAVPSGSYGAGIYNAGNYGG